MGLFSFITSDTGRSIIHVASGTPFTVHLIAPDLTVYTEHEYQGHGVFGGMDIFLFIAILNGWHAVGNTIEDSRRYAIREIFAKHGDFKKAYLNGVILPKLVEVVPKNKSDFDYLPLLQPCPKQGY